VWGASCTALGQPASTPRTSRTGLTPSAIQHTQQRLEQEIADFSKDADKRLKAAQTKLKAAKQVCRVWVWWWCMATSLVS
jgi:hypothetical protein